MIEIKSGRKRFNCTSKDVIMFNGAVYQLITQTYWKDWTELTPIISKTEFNRLLKLNVLKKPYLVKRLGITVTIYQFK